MTDTGHHQWNNQALKWMAVEYTFLVEGAESFLVQDTIVEQIGNINEYLLPWDYYERAIDGGQGGPLVCYQEAGEVATGFNGAICNITQTIVPDQKDAFAVWPNPFQNELTITSKIGMQSILIVDLTGRPVLQAKWNGTVTSYRLETSTSPSGLYGVIVKSETGSVVIHKVVRQ
ncbi:MAG: T9SS type A sorting domain-containing protein [Saprospiraceae bacterium]|nr:T9SS type A sorting domain-containing protein [Saprospiraceae bacterium]MDZ4703495.1 T9SS type A sorting domain-containing protein [Saprospiraceae bacterium]